MTARRQEALQWFGLFGGPAAWATHLVLGFEVGEASCGTGLGPFSSTATMVTATVVLAGVVVLAEAAAVTVLRHLLDVDKDAPGPEGRQRFLAYGAVVGNVLLFVAIVLAGVATIAATRCQGA